MNLIKKKLLILVSKKYNTFMTKVWKVHYKKHLRFNQNSITFIMTFKIISTCNSNVKCKDKSNKGSNKMYSVLNCITPGRYSSS